VVGLGGSYQGSHRRTALRVVVTFALMAGGCGSAPSAPGWRSGQWRKPPEHVESTRAGDEPVQIRITRAQARTAAETIFPRLAAAGGYDDAVLVGPGSAPDTGSIPACWLMEVVGTWSPGSAPIVLGTLLVDPEDGHMTWIPGSSRPTQWDPDDWITFKHDSRSATAVVDALPEMKNTCVGEKQPNRAECGTWIVDPKVPFHEGDHGSVLACRPHEDPEGCPWEVLVGYDEVLDILNRVDTFYIHHGDWRILYVKTHCGRMTVDGWRAYRARFGKLLDHPRKDRRERLRENPPPCPGEPDP
jgi:hypothetical protein